MEMNYCRRCGKPLSTENKTIFRCSNGHSLYINSAPTVSILAITHDGNLLLSRRGIEPGKGLLDVFGGFIEDMETAEDAAIRELEEETGLTPAQYSRLEYINSGSATYLYEGERRSILSLCYITIIKPGVTLSPQDDVAEIIEMSVDEFDPQDLWNEDIKIGYRDIHAILKGARIEV